jgi:hypothetical protein
MNTPPLKLEALKLEEVLITVLPFGPSLTPVHVMVGTRV